ncbi:hypothetical protein NE865_04707 [Phthorimaea operculella]|nr:hypothetical protein NE865_04707 [Phthorimaea operculella]
MSNFDTQVLQSMAATREFVAKKIADFQAELKQAGRKQPNSIAALNREFVAFKEMVCNALNVLQTQVDLIARGQDRLEMHSRRKMLLVHGVAEEKNENTTSRLTTLLSSKISSVDIAPGSIRTSHRMGTNKSDPKGKPRPILVKFADTSARDRIWFGKKALKDSGVTLSEFLTKPRHEAFMAARNKFGVKNCWTQNGFIQVKTSSGEKHRIESMMELDRLIAGSQSGTASQ